MIARARAEEIRFGATDPYQRGVERLGAGQGWLQEAELVAETEAVRLRAFREMLARLLALGDMQAAEALLQRAQQRLASPQSIAAIAQWRAALESVTAALAEVKSERHTLARQTYQQVLERRLQQARARGNTQAEARYRALLENATPPKPQKPTDAAQTQ